MAFTVELKPVEFFALDTDDENLTKVADCLHSIFQIDSNLALATAQKIFRLQTRLQADETISIAPSDVLPYELVITKERIHSLKRKIGEGTHATVFESTVIPTVRHVANHFPFSPGKPKAMAVKRMKMIGTTFSPEKRRLDHATQHGSEGIDRFLATFKDDKGVGYCLNQLYAGDLTKIAFHCMPKPVLKIVTVLEDIAKGLMNLHSTKSVHRDVKGANILVDIPEQDQKKLPKEPREDKMELDQIGGAMSDFGLLQESQAEVHETIGTPSYLDPSMFGSQQMSLLNQKKRRGLQTEAGDVFAFGITIFKDILIKFISQKAQGSAAKASILSLMQDLTAEKIAGPFTDTALKVFGRQSHFRMVYAINKQQKEYLMRYPEIDAIRNNLRAACDLLSDVLSLQEREGLIKLTELSCRMQTVDKNKRPLMEVVHTELADLLGTLGAPTSKKRRLDFANLEDQPEPKRFKKEIMPPVVPELDSEALESIETVPTIRMVPGLDDA